MESKAGQFPASIWYDWDEAHRVAKVALKSPRNKAILARAFQVVGSLDSLHWTTLMSVENPGSDDGQEFKYWVIPEFRQNDQFRRIVVRTPNGLVP